VNRWGDWLTGGSICNSDKKPSNLIKKPRLILKKLTPNYIFCIYFDSILQTKCSRDGIRASFWQTSCLQHDIVVGRLGLEILLIRDLLRRTAIYGAMNRAVYSVSTPEPALSGGSCALRINVMRDLTGYPWTCQESKDLCTNVCIEYTAHVNTWTWTLCTKFGCPAYYCIYLT
jgi:hypothetical protein